MSEITCPHCHKTFKIDEAGYAAILKQIKDREFSKELHERLELLKKQNSVAVELAVSKTEADFSTQLAKKDLEITELKSKATAALNDLKSKSALEVSNLQAEINSVKNSRELEIAKAVEPIKNERDTLLNEVKIKESEQKLSIANLKDKYSNELKSKDEMIAYYKDMKAKLSTKMIGESLEQHCQVEFERLRATAFKNAEFTKDNDARTGSKGDFIYREHDEAGNEIISIMFEMKNEGDETATKHKNEDFLKELDKDRREKKCEYAVLVTLLEAENELYNTGIVDVSHLFDKMYVVRPQFFIPIITVLRNAALNSMQYKSELALIRAQNIDITNFENELESIKTGFARNYDLAGRKFASAIDDIDKTIKLLQRTKEELLSSDNNLRLANNKLQDVTIKRLTKNNPTMAEKFEDLK